MTDYHHAKLGLIWSKESKVTEGGGIRPPQVENVLNRPGEIGLTLIYMEGQICPQAVFATAQKRLALDC